MYQRDYTVQEQNVLRDMKHLSPLGERWIVFLIVTLIYAQEHPGWRSDAIHAAIAIFSPFVTGFIGFVGWLGLEMRKR